ncbi:porin family protein [uncultured Tenacibaculum sp.]|uniref:porin family protein n=1 Tax=uncultured Tenacibaculum sp. TaxID=174713 RepID=UPI0026155A1D|nr:porin family protein [uncultured Tenacibaculum sp.]
MKKLLLVAMIAVGITAKAQETSFGAVAGFNSTTVSASSNGISASTSASGFYVGFFADFEVSDKISIVPELQYVSASKNGESINEIALPIMAKYNVSEKFSLQAGPMLDLVVDKTSDEFNKFGLGLAAGIGYDFTENIFATSRYSFGLTNRVENSSVSTKMGFFQIGLGYRF